jgi:hypothetical protein
VFFYAENDRKRGNDVVVDVHRGSCMRRTMFDESGVFSNKKMHKTIPALSSFQHHCHALSFGCNVSVCFPHHGAGTACDFRR